MPELDEANAFFQEATRNQHLPRMNALAVQLTNVLRLLGDVKGVSGIQLHAVGQLEGLNTRFQPRVLPSALDMFLVELMQQVELLPLLFEGGVIVANVFDQLLQLRVLRVNERALIHAEQESGT